MNTKLTAKPFRLATMVMSLAVSAALVGCDNQEEVMEVETPESSVEVERDVDTGELSVDAEEE